jgi:hypothetical protein
MIFYPSRFAHENLVKAREVTDCDVDSWFRAHEVQVDSQAGEILKADRAKAQMPKGAHPFWK